MSSRALVPLLSSGPAAGRVTPDQLAGAVVQFLERDRDYPAVADGMLEQLLRPDQDRRPDEMSLAVAHVAPAVAAMRHGVSPSLTFRIAHRDVHVRPELRGRWEADVFPRTVILALAAGARRRNFPPHLAGVLPYLLVKAEEQVRDILAAGEESRAAPRPRGAGPTTAELAGEMEQQIEAVRHKGRVRGLPQHVIDFEVAHLRQQFLAEPSEEGRR